MLSTILTRFLKFVKAVLEGIVKAQAAAQPFVYPTGLNDVPMSPISDIGVFCNARWKLDDFLRVIRLDVERAIKYRAVFALLAHPSGLYPNDPKFKTVELLCDLVEQAGDRAAIVDRDTIAKQTTAASR